MLQHDDLIGALPVALVGDFGLDRPGSWGRLRRGAVLMAAGMRQRGWAIEGMGPTLLLSLLAAEANPLIEQLVNEHAVGFVAVKLGLVGMGSWLLWKRRESPLAVVAIFVAFVTYYGVAVYHVQYAAALVGHLLH